MFLLIVHIILNNIFKVPTEQPDADEKEEVFETITIYGYLVFLS